MAIAESAEEARPMWQNLKTSGNVSDHIERYILDLLSTEKLRAGDRLPSERELASMLGVSRPSLREAVKSLEAHGVLRVQHGRGVFVAAPRVGRELRDAVSQQKMTLSELFDMREVLEVPAAGWAIGGGVEKIGEIGKALSDLDDAAHAGRDEFYMLQRLDAAFHLRIVEAANNRFLSQTLGVLQDILAAGMETTLVIPGRLEKSSTEHHRIFEAIRSGDAAKARTAARRHIRSARSAAMNRLEAEMRAANGDRN